MLVTVARTDDIARGGLLAVAANGHPMVIGNYNGKFYAVKQRCNHMNASLDKGTLYGYILTCPLHHMQYDITTGKALSGPVAKKGAPVADLDSLDLQTFPIVIDGGEIKIEI